MLFTVSYSVNVREDTYYEASAKIAAGTDAPYEIIDIVPADGSIEDVSDQEMPWCHQCRGHYQPHRHS